MRVLIDLPDDDLASLDALAQRNGRSRAAEVREAVRLHLRRRDDDWILRGFGYWKQRKGIERAIREDRGDLMSDPIFDTDIVMDWLRGRQEAADELTRYPRHRISRISWMQILAREPLEQRDHVQELIAPFEIVELDARIAQAAADLRHRLRMKLTDAMILATAQVNGAILVTRNIKDFPAQMPGVRVPYSP